LHAIPWYVVLFESIPEAFLVVILGFALFSYPIRHADALIISVMSGIITFFVRQLSIVFGLHTLIALVILIFLCSWIAKINPWKGAVSIIAGIAVLGVLQSITLPICFRLTSTTLDDILINPWLNVLFFLPDAIIMLAIYLVIRKRHFNILNLNQGSMTFKNNYFIIIFTLLLEILFIGIVNIEICITQDITILGTFLPFANLAILISSGFVIFAIKQVMENARTDVDEIVGAFNGMEAIRLAREYQPDIAFLDIELSLEEGFNGIQVAAMINDISPETKLVFVTGYTKYALDCYSVHPYDYLVKPITKGSLLI